MCCSTWKTLIVRYAGSCKYNYAMVGFGERALLCFSLVCHTLNFVVCCPSQPGPLYFSS